MHHRQQNEPNNPNSLTEYTSKKVGLYPFSFDNMSFFVRMLKGKYFIIKDSQLCFSMLYNCYTAHSEASLNIHIVHLFK